VSKRHSEAVFEFTGNGGEVRVRKWGQTRTPTNSELLMPSESTQLEEPGVRSALNRVFGVDELAVFFGCSTEKIKRRARNRELPAFKFGKSWYVREQDLERYIEQAVASNLRLDREKR
jgi:excisionase family DNA binding protein